MGDSDEVLKARDQADFRARIESKVDQVNNSLSGLEKRFDNFNTGMGKRIDEMSRIIMDHSILMPGIKEGVDDWKDTKKWVTRIIVGGIITALLGIIIIKR